MPLVGIQSLGLSGCEQDTITDAAFVPLTGIQSLDMTRCNQPSITDAAFAPLAGIQSLIMTGCSFTAQSAARALGRPAVWLV